MRERGRGSDEPTDAKPGPNDQAYLLYGSLSARKSQSWRPGSATTAAPRRTSWKRVAIVMTLAAIPVGVLGMSWLWKNRASAQVSPEVLALRMVEDRKACHAGARKASSDGTLRFDPATRDQCLIDLGWTLDARGEPVECVGRCGVRDDGTR